ncbi:MAG: type II secretion system F family protein [Erysipelotrichaceae bacterium]|nr:type II secretion system F family protein [Erysipelotrichaceae bacterium]
MKKTKSLSFQDLCFLSSLLSTGLSLSFAMELLKEKRNAVILEDILKRMEKGEGAEETFQDHLPEGLGTYLLPLCRVLPFQEALSLSLSFRERQEKSRKEILGSLAYPCILLFVSLTLLYLFDLYGLDTILSLLSAFQESGEAYLILRKIIRVVIHLFFLLLLIFLAGFLYFSSAKRLVYFYVLLSRCLPDSLLHLYYTGEFISLFAETVKMGYKTKESMDILKTIRKKPVISFLAYHLDEELSGGSTLKEAASLVYFDSSLSHFLRIASHTSSFAEILETYADLCLKRIQKKAKALTLVIQCLSYAFIGIVLIFIYRILFIPMQAISGF